MESRDNRLYHGWMNHRSVEVSSLLRSRADHGSLLFKGSRRRGMSEQCAFHCGVHHRSDDLALTPPGRPLAWPLANEASSAMHAAHARTTARARRRRRDCQGLLRLDARC